MAPEPAERRLVLVERPQRHDSGDKLPFETVGMPLEMGGGFLEFDDLPAERRSHWLKGVLFW